MEVGVFVLFNSIRSRLPKGACVGGFLTGALVLAKGELARKACQFPLTYHLNAVNQKKTTAGGNGGGGASNSQQNGSSTSSGAPVVVAAKKPDRPKMTELKGD